MVNFDEIFIVNTKHNVYDNLKYIYDGLYSNKTPVDVGILKILFTGYIFNFKEISNHGEETIEQLIASLYREKSLSEIIGMIEGYYVAVIFDKRKTSIISDKYGIESGYYIENDTSNQFVFSTSLVCLNKYSYLTFDPINVAYYLVFSDSPRGTTLFKDVKALKRAEYLVIDNGFIKEKGNNDIVDRLISQQGSVKKMLTKEVLEKIDTIIKEGLESIKKNFPESKIVNQLSGGTDSSLLQSILMDLGEKRSYCNNIKYHGLDGYYSTDVASYLGCEHEILDYTLDELRIAIDNGIKMTMSSSVFIGEGMLNGLFKKLGVGGQTISVSGNGADALFGHGRHLKIAKHLYGKPLIYLKFVKLITSFINHDKLSIIQYYPDDSKRVFLDGFIERMFTRPNLMIEKNIMKDVIEIKRQEIIRNDTPIHDIIYTNWLFNGEITWTNKLNYKLAKNNGVCIYCPYIMEDLVGYMITIPVKLLLQGYENKYYIKKYLCDRIPKNMIYRKKIDKGLPWNTFLETYNINDVEELRRNVLEGVLRCENIKSIYAIKGYEAFSLKLRNLSYLCKCLNNY